MSADSNPYGWDAVKPSLAGQTLRKATAWLSQVASHPAAVKHCQPSVQNNRPARPPEDGEESSGFSLLSLLRDLNQSEFSFNAQKVTQTPELSQKQMILCPN